MGGICETNPRAAATDVRSCCAEHPAAGGEAPARSPADPCSRQCCKMGPAIPIIHDSAVNAQLAPLPVAFTLVPAVEAEAAATFCEPLSPGRSIQILHCRWRL
jgi:hypothetical protein